MFYAKCELVEFEVKRTVKDLLDKWMRPIMNRSDDYKDRVLRHAEYDGERKPTMKKPKKDDLTTDLISSMIKGRARLPDRTTTSYSIAPISSVLGASESKVSI